MAFFGITALGPQNVFAKVERNSTTLQIFDESDFVRAWEKINEKGVTACRSEKLESILKALFHGPVPSHDRPFLDNAFSSVSSIITLSDYLNILNNLKADLESYQQQLSGKPKPTCEFTSCQEYQQHMLTHKPSKFNLQDKQIAPLTAMQEYGWTQETPELPKHGRGGTDITKFASELIKSGVYY